MEICDELVGVDIYANVFFFMQMTAYEIRNGDWSSETCALPILPTTGPMLLHALQSQDMYLAGSFLIFLAMLTDRKASCRERV